MRVRGHKLEVVSTRPGTHLAMCSCGEVYKAPDHRVHPNVWRSYEAPKYRALHQAHLEEVKISH